MNSIEVLHVVKVLVAFAFLLEASRRDIRERLVSNKLWVYMILIFAPLNVLEYVIRPFSLAFAILQFIFVSAFSYAVYWLGLYGGADAKALMSLSFAFPVYPFFYSFPLLGRGLNIFAFSTLANSVIVAPALVILIFVKNVLSRDLEFPYCLIGYKKKLEEVKFHNLLERVENGKIHRGLRGIEANEEEIKKLKKAGLKEVWVTPALPFICFITAGFIVAVFVGDIMFYLIRMVL